MSIVIIFTKLRFITFQLNINTELKIMNITLHSYPCRTDLEHNSSPTKNTHFNKNFSQQQLQSPFYSHCPGFVFGNCQGQADRLITEQNQIQQNYQKIKYSKKKQKDQERQVKIQNYQSNRKQKICLSLRQPLQKYQTPSKKANNKNFSSRCYTQCKNRFISEKQVQNMIENNTSQKKVVHLNRKMKIKTEPVQHKKSIEINMHQLKESLKPSTNVVTPAIKPSKQSNNSSSRKLQLTISNNFKSSLVLQKRQTQSKICPTSFTGKKIESPFVSQQVFVQESFMTAKLQNIYGQIQNSFMQHPSSNIVYYNQIMADQTTWKYPQTINLSQLKKEDYNQLTKQIFEPNKPKKKIVIKNTSILHNIQDEQQRDKMNQIIQKQKIDIRDKFMERKYIGEYAKTIKTFNQSQFKSEHESVVLQHGIPSNFFINRGSIKEYPREPESQIIKRQCSSFGQDHQNSYQISRERKKQFTSPPIQESDSQKQS